MGAMCEVCGVNEGWITHNGVLKCKHCFKTVSVRVPKGYQRVLGLPRTIRRALYTTVREYEEVNFVHAAGQKFKVLKMKSNHYRLGAVL